MSVGVDQMGGCNDPSLLMSAYGDMKSEKGEAEAEKAFRESVTMDTAPWKDVVATCDLPLSQGMLS